MSGEWSDEQERAMVDRLKNRVGELGDERDRLLGELRSSRQLDALTIRSMRTQRDRAVALLREVCETSYDDLAALRGNINAACDWLESFDGPDEPAKPDPRCEACDGTGRVRPGWEVVFSLTNTYCRVTTVEDAAPVRCTRCFYTFGAADNAVFDDEGEEWMCLPCAVHVGELCLERIVAPVPSADTELRGRIHRFLEEGGEGS